MALVLDPLYPLAGEEVTLSATSTNGASTFAFELTSRPSASAVTLGLLLTGLATATTRTLSPLLAARAGILGDTFTPDVPGEYAVKVYDLVERTSIPSFYGDPLAAGDAGFELLAIQSATAHVGGAVTLPLLTSAGRGATLELGIVNETIRTAELVDPTDEGARVALLDTVVAAAVAALVGSSVATIMGDFVARVEDLRAQLDAGDHYGAGGGTPWHSGSGDAVNPVQRSQVTDPTSAIDALNACRRSLEGHLRDNGVSTAWHTTDDRVNVPLAGEAATVGEAQVLLSDLRERVYERHRVLGSGASPGVHLTAGGDGSNTLSSPTLFDAVVIALFDILAAVAVSAAAGESEGIADAVAAGFSR